MFSTCLPLLRIIAITFYLLAFIALQAHNFIAHEHQQDVHEHEANHHHIDGSSHSHHHEDGKKSDNHNPEFGKYLLTKQEFNKIVVDQLCIILPELYCAFLTNDDPSVPLYYISPHKSFASRLLLTSLPFRGPPVATML